MSTRSPRESSATRRAGRALALLVALTGIGLVAGGPAVAASAPAAGPDESGIVATFSCVGFDPDTGDLGIAVQSKFFAVGAVVPWARAGVGAIATQAFANTAYGPTGLGLLAGGAAPEEVVRALTEADSLRARRQIGIVDAQGRSAGYTGTECLTWAGGRTGKSFAVQGNILAGPDVVRAMADAYEKTPGMLGDRLIAALEAGQAAGGDSRGMQSAALLIVREGGGYAGYNDRYCDLRVDDAVEPIAELRRIYEIWKPNALVTEGYTRVERGEYEAAYEMGREAIRLRPGEGEYRFHLACYYSRGGRIEEALETLAEAARLDPTLGARATTDTDLAPLRDDPRFGRILEAATKAARQK